MRGVDDEGVLGALLAVRVGHQLQVLHAHHPVGGQRRLGRAAHCQVNRYWSSSMHTTYNYNYCVVLHMYCICTYNAVHISVILTISTISFYQVYSQLRPILMPSMESTPLSLARLRLCKGVAALLNLVEVPHDFLHSDFPCTCNAVAITMQEM